MAKRGQTCKRYYKREKQISITRRQTSSYSRSRGTGYDTGLGRNEDKGEDRAEKVLREGKEELDEYGGTEIRREQKRKEKYDMKPIRVTALPKKINYDYNEVEEDMYAIIQDREYRFLVKILKKESKQRIIGQYLRSWEHPTEKERKFKKLWWDPQKKVEILGGSRKTYLPYEIQFRNEDIYVQFEELEQRNIPEWYGRDTLICS